MSEPLSPNPLQTPHTTNVTVSNFTTNEQNSQSHRSRRYMSKSQRACDFCRSRKTACRIVNLPPCRLCSQHGCACTFNKETVRRQPKETRSLQQKTMSALQSGRELTPRASTSFSQETLIDDGAFSAEDHGQSDEPNAGVFGVDNLTPDGSFNDYSNSHFENVVGLADDSTMNLNINTTQDLSDEILDSILRSEASPLDDDTLRYYVGPTGEQDPNLLRRYRFNDHNEFWFKKLGIRTTSPGPNPTLWMLSLSKQHPVISDDSIRQSPTDKQRELLESLVQPNIGGRIISL